jgi:protein phosphatase 2C family protein 2/3
MLAYGANTHNGIIRSYNEDRISIVLDLKRPDQVIKEQHVSDSKIMFFAIFDGHGG